LPRLEPRHVTWPVLTTLGCLALLGGCSKAAFYPDSGSGGGIGTGGTIDGSGGSGGESVDTPPDEAAVSDGEDTAEVDSTPDVPVEMPDSGMDADSANDMAGDAPTDGPSGMRPTLLGQLLISEVMYDNLAVKDDFGEWFELYNPSPGVTYELSGCGVSDSSPSHTQTISKSVLVKPGAYVTLALFSPGGTPSDTPGFVPDYFYSGFKLDSDTTGDTVVLSCAGVIIDQFTYTISNPREEGRSIGVDPDHLTPNEHNLPAYECRGQAVIQTTGMGTDYGTPGVKNPSCPPPI
jgi:hypothetical protein